MYLTYCSPELGLELVVSLPIYGLVNVTAGNQSIILLYEAVRNN